MRRQGELGQYSGQQWAGLPAEQQQQQLTRNPSQDSSSPGEGTGEEEECCAESSYSTSESCRPARAGLQSVEREQRAGPDTENRQHKTHPATPTTSTPPTQQPLIPPGNTDPHSSVLCPVLCAKYKMFQNSNWTYVPIVYSGI